MTGSDKQYMVKDISSIMLNKTTSCKIESNYLLNMLRIVAL